MPRKLVVEIVGDASSLEKAATESAAALREIKLDPGQAAESRVTASQILEGVRGISESSRLAAQELDQVRLTIGDAATSAAAGDAIKANIGSIGDAATLAAAKIALIGVALGAHFGGGGGGGGILAALMGWGRRGRGMFGLPFATLGSLGMFAGFGLEHALVTLGGVAGSGIQAMLGAGFLGLGAGGTMAVGMGTNMAGIGQAANDTKAVAQAIGQYQHGLQALAMQIPKTAAAQQALNQALNAFAPRARAAVEVAALTANRFHWMFNYATGAAESVGAQILTEAMHVGMKFLPTIGRYALQNMNIIKQDIQPLFDWLKNGAFSGPGRGGGLGIFNDLERIFQRKLPTSIHAMSQGFELLVRVIDVSAQHLGGFISKLNEILTKLNGVDFGKVSHFVNSSIQAFHVWMTMFVNLGKALYEAFKPALGVGRMIVQDLGDAFGALAKYLGAKGTQDVLHKLFSAHKQELEAIIGVLSALGPVINGALSAFMQIEAVVTKLVAGPLKLLADLIRGVLDIPFVGKLAGWTIGVGLFVVALDKFIVALSASRLVGLATAVWQGIATAATLAYSAATGIATVATTAFAAVMDTVGAPILLVVAAVAALGVAAYEIYTHWGAVSKFFSGLWGDVKRLFGEGISFVASHWRDFLIGLATIVAGPLGLVVSYMATHWAQVKSDAANAWHEVVNTIRSTLGEAVNAAEAIGRGIYDGVIHPIASLASRLLSALESAIRDAIHAVSGWASGVASSIGSSLVGGILGPLKGMAGAVSGAVHSGLGWFEHPHFSGTPYQVASQNVGYPLARGVIAGFLEGITSLPYNVKQSVLIALEQAKAQVQQYRSQFQNAFSSLVGAVDQSIGGYVTAANTPAGKQLAALQAAYNAQQLQQALAQAQQQLAADQASGASAQTITADQQALANAQYNIQVAALQKEAAAQAQHLSNMHALRKAEANRALTDLEARLAKQGATEKEAQDDIVKMLRKYGVTYHDVAVEMGKKFAQGLESSIRLTARAAEELAREIAKYLPHSPAEKGPLSRPIGWQNYFLSGLTGAVGSVNGAMGGLAGVGAGASRLGGPTVNVTVQGSLVGATPQQIADELKYPIRDALLTIGRSEPSIFHGFA